MDRPRMAGPGDGAGPGLEHGGHIYRGTNDLRRIGVWRRGRGRDFLRPEGAFKLTGSERGVSLGFRLSAGLTASRRVVVYTFSTKGLCELNQTHNRIDRSSDLAVLTMSQNQLQSARSPAGKGANLVFL